MGSIVFQQGVLADNLHEVIGYKSGVAASLEHMCDLLSGSGYEDQLIDSEQYGLRIRSEDYESLYYLLLHKIGATEKPIGGMLALFALHKEIEKACGTQISNELQEIFHRHIKLAMKRAFESNVKALDTRPMIIEAHKKYGKLGSDAIIKLIEGQNKLLENSPASNLRFKQYDDILNLNDLFKTYEPATSDGTFLDQRFIDFLSVNGNKIGEIHWRKFEELTAECFCRFGYTVELGPGSNDDGVDIRVWNKDDLESPKYIIQCKRTKSKIDKVTIKGLYADTLHERSEFGILVTSSELSIGARNTISARSYPLKEVNGDKLRIWLNELRTPGTGIIRV